MSEWVEAALGDLASVVTGQTPQADEADSWGDFCDFITPSDQRDGVRDVRPERRLSTVGMERLVKRLVPTGATNLTCIGSTIGKVSQTLSPAVTNQQINSLIAREGITHPGYLYYMIKDWSPSLASAASGSATPIVNKAVLSRFVFRVPPLKEQRAIAEVLGALDDKIAANTRAATTARELMVSLTSLAQGRCELRDVVEIVKSSVKPEELGDAAVDHFSLPAFDVGEGPELIQADAIKSNKTAIAQPSVLVSKLNPRIPRVWDVVTVSERPSLGSTEFLVLEPRGVTSSVLWAVLSQPAFWSELSGMVAGTSGSHQRVRPDDVLGVEVIDPRSISEPCRGAITALGERVDQFRAEIVALANTRDALLPLLLSGRVTVKDAESLVEGVA
ncbi:MAG: restriction endonuclease subunit S [Nocardioidaceae bacterium]|nr:restriction endonuclease subunit S [Nocardioidaceae bacterium]